MPVKEYLWLLNNQMRRAVENCELITKHLTAQVDGFLQLGTNAKSTRSELNRAEEGISAWKMLLC